MSASAAVSISYQLVDLPDVTPSQDLWRYDYRLAGSFAQFNSVEILYAAPQVASLDAVLPSPNASWDISAVQPLAGIPADGVYMLMALAADPVLASPFQVTFVWNGPGLPGAQAFNVLDGGFNLLESGATQLAPIPEPGIYAQIILGLALIAANAWRRNSS